LFAAEQLFGDIDAWLRSQTDLPIWWAEWYATPNSLSDEQQNALLATSVLNMMPVASVALRWAPGGDADEDRGDQESVWTDTRRPDGGKPFPFAQTMTGFTDCFPPNTEYRLLESRDVRGAAGAHCAMLINTRPDKIAIVYKSQRLTLSPYAVVFLK
jgi:hypothetical protein